MRRMTLILTITALLASSLCGVADAANIKALLITGDDVGPHPWRMISEATREVLVESGRFDVNVCEDPLILESANALKAYDVIVFTAPSTLHRLLEGGWCSRSQSVRALGRTAIVAIGTVTARAVEDEGLRTAAVAASPTDDGIVEAVTGLFRA